VPPVSGAGDYTARQSLCWLGISGGKVSASVGGVTSKVVTW
jgi:hypothetical protein